MGIEMQLEVVIEGAVTGMVLGSAEPLSFWGGYDHTTGNIIDKRHPLAGECAAGRILALPHTRGSSTTTAVLLEAVKAETAPAAIISTARDTFFTLASVVADEMYAKPIPIFVVDSAEFAQLQTGQQVNISAEGKLTILG